MTPAINKVSARSMSDSAKPQAIARSIGMPVTFYADAAFAGFAALLGLLWQIRKGSRSIMQSP
jgi:hypothetical protein